MKRYQKIIATLVLVVLVVVVAGYIIHRNREVNDDKISQLRDYCLALKEGRATLAEANNYLPDSIVETRVSSEILTFSTSKSTFSPTCRVKYDESSNEIKQVSFIRD